jgi:hypothetical protein
MMRLAFSLAGAALLAGCGTNRPEIPPELLQTGGCETGDYPAGPYGSEPGTVAQNFCFEGVRAPNPGRADEQVANLEEVSFGNFYDPAGSRYELILVNSAAIWCSACQVEHQTLPEHASELGDEGLVILSALFQDAKRNPATADDLLAWIETFEPNFPMVLDPDYQLGAYASAETAPLNLVIDARNMQILQKFIGDQASVLWPYLEDELAQRR